MIDFLVWTDLETTAFKPGHIVELACIVTDNKLQEKGRFHSFIKPPPLWEWDQSIREFHEGTGLLADLDALAYDMNNSDAWDLVKVSEKFLNFLHEHLGTPAARPRERNAMLAGNSVHFDHEFLEARMNDALGFCHYRRLDVSGFKTSLEIGTQTDMDMPKDGKHRAMPDIEESIEQYKALWDRLGAWYADEFNGLYPWEARPRM